LKVSDAPQEKDLIMFCRCVFMRRKTVTFLVALGLFLLMIPHSESTDERVVTFAKCLPDGSMETFTMNVKCYAGETLSDSIARKCREILSRDDDMQKYAGTVTGLYLLVSAGDGFHLSLPSSFLRSSYFNIIYSLLPNIVYCNYDSTQSHTDIYPIAPAGNETLLTGPHKVLCIGFVGIIGWTGYFSFSTTGFAGFTPFVWYA